jgi:hypothetical protein
MHTEAPSSSGVMHAPVRQRWLEGDLTVLEGVRELAAIADTGRYVCVPTPACRRERKWKLAGN